MTTARSISSSDAKASLGELLGSLVTDGPVEITRNGRKVALLTATSERDRPVEASRLADLAALYAGGKVTWREISAETGVAFGDLLAALSQQNLQLPRVTPVKRPEQVAMFNEVLRRAAKR